MEELRKYQFIDSWCIASNILIYAVPIDNKTLRIEINKGGKIIPGKLVYSQFDMEWQLKIRELRQWYFDKYLEKREKRLKNEEDNKDNPTK